MLNKYFPPDFDPALIPRRKRAKNNEMKIRMMLPFSLRCDTCGEYMYRGKKFNSRKEDVPEEAYLGIMVFRFYIRCTRCNAEITFKTDPRNSDYTAELGCARNFEPWRDKEKKEDELNAAKDKEESEDAMKKLENVTRDSKREMDILDALDEVRMLNARNNDITTDQMLHDLRERADKDAQARAVKTTDEDEEEVKAAFNATLRRVDDAGESSNTVPDSSALSASKPTSLWGQNLQKEMAAKMEQKATESKQKKKPMARFLKRKVADPEEQPQPASVPPAKEQNSPGSSDGNEGGGLGLLGGYGSSSSGGSNN